MGKPDMENATPLFKTRTSPNSNELSTVGKHNTWPLAGENAEVLVLPTICLLPSYRGQRKGTTSKPWPLAYPAQKSETLGAPSESQWAEGLASVVHLTSLRSCWTRKLEGAHITT